MVVDCHTHIRSASVENLDASEHLAAADVVNKCIVLASIMSPNDAVWGGEQEASSEQVNNHLSQYVERYGEKMVGFAFLNPTRR